MVSKGEFLRLNAASYPHSFRQPYTWRLFSGLPGLNAASYPHSFRRDNMGGICANCVHVSMRLLTRIPSDPYAILQDGAEMAYVSMRLLTRIPSDLFHPDVDISRWDVSMRLLTRIPS